jgi:hypothetical protein
MTQQKAISPALDVLRTLSPGHPDLPQVVASSAPEARQLPENRSFGENTTGKRTCS